MTTQNQAILNELSNNLQAALTKLKNAQGAYDAVMVNVRELQRQAEVHRASGANNDLQIVNGQLTAAYVTEKTSAATLNDAKSSYNTALAAYEATASRLLDPAEAQLQATALTQKMSAENGITPMPAPSFFSTTPGIITIVVAGLSIIGLSIYLIKR
jgi:hypothetical protein